MGNPSREMGLIEEFPRTNSCKKCGHALELEAFSYNLDALDAQKK